MKKTITCSNISNSCIFLQTAICIFKKKRNICYAVLTYLENPDS